MAVRRSGLTQKKQRPARLPTSRTVLAAHLKLAIRCIAYLDAYCLRERMLYEQLESAEKQPKEYLRLKGFRRILSKAQMRTIAGGFPNPDSIVPFMNQDRIQQLLARLSDTEGRPPSVDESSPIELLKPWVKYQRKQLRVFEQLSNEFRKLRARLEHEMEKPRRSADSKADTQTVSKRPNVLLPENPLVLKLAREIDRRIDQEHSKRAIALQLVNGSPRAANSLLRQLRRYPHLIRPRKS